jgi:hypothetical protein
VYTYYLCTQILYCPLGQQVISLLHRVHRVAMAILSGEHSIMSVKSAQAGEGGGCSPTPFPYTVSNITYKVAV